MPPRPLSSESEQHQVPVPGAADAPAQEGGGPSVRLGISVCITTRGRAALLDRCLTALHAQTGTDPFELLVCCQGDGDAAAVVRSHFPDATIGLVEEAYPGGARNFLIDRARGELLLFLDDDVTFGTALLSRLTGLADDFPDVGVFGGPNLTPPDSSFFQEVQGAILGSVLATGPVRRRYGRHPAGLADERFFTLCNMAVRRTAMTSFPPSLSGGEENALLHELAVRQVPMHYDPELIVFHERRNTYRGFATQMEKYGRGRGQVMIRSPRSTRVSHLLPLGLLAWMVSLPIVAVLWSPWYLLSLAVYALALLAAGSAVALGFVGPSLARRAGGVLIGAGLTATVHVCYGAGVLRGILRRRRTPQSEWQHLGGPSEVQSPFPTDQLA
jgi:hypothetical protein